MLLPPALLYTDAEGLGGIGAVLAINGAVSWFLGRAPKAFMRLAGPLGYPRGMPVYLLEAAVPFLSLHEFGRLLQGRRVIVFVDNQSALGALFKGRSRRSRPLNELCFSLWERSRRSGVELFFRWVPSRFNLADPPSRGLAPPCGGLQRPRPTPAHWRRVIRAMTSAT